MNNNRAEAERWLGIAEKLLASRDLHGTRTFAIRAREYDPVLADEILAVVDTLLAAQSHPPDYYRILQLPHLCPSMEILKSQYQKLAMLLNPSRNRLLFADQAFRLVSEAWTVLSNPSKKAIYDNELRLSLLGQMSPLSQQQQQQMEVQTQLSLLGQMGQLSQQQPPPQPQPHHHPHEQPRQTHMWLNQVGQVSQASFQVHEQPPREAQSTQIGQSPRSNHGRAAAPAAEERPFFNNQIGFAPYGQVSQSESILPAQVQPNWTESPRPIQLNQNESVGPFQPNQNESARPFQSNQNESPRPVQPNQTESAPPVQRNQTESAPPVQPKQTESARPVQVKHTESSRPIPPSQNDSSRSVRPTPKKPTQRVQSNLTNQAEKEPTQPEEVIQTETRSSEVNESAPTSEATDSSQEQGFWTACPYCYTMFEYLKVYKDCSLRCQSCSRAFQAVPIPSPPPAGENNYICCWGFFPVGISANAKLGGAWGANWSPFSPMFPSAGQPEKMEKAPWVYYDDGGGDDDEAFVDPSDSEDSSDVDWRDVKATKKKKNKSLTPSKKRKSKGRVGRPPGSKNVKKKRTESGGEGQIEVEQANGSVENLGGESIVKSDVAAVESSKRVSSNSARKQLGRRGKDLGKLDLNVEFSNDVEEQVTRMRQGNAAGYGVDDNIEGNGFFEGLDEFLSSLPILNVVTDDKVKAT